MPPATEARRQAGRAREGEYREEGKKGRTRGEGPDGMPRWRQNQHTTLRRRTRTACTQGECERDACGLDKRKGKQGGTDGQMQHDALYLSVGNRAREL